MSQQIKKILSVGDVIYPLKGKPLKVTAIMSRGFKCGNSFFLFSEHRKKYYLHEKSVKGDRL